MFPYSGATDGAGRDAAARDGVSRDRLTDGRPAEKAAAKVTLSGKIKLEQSSSLINCTLFSSFCEKFTCDGSKAAADCKGRVWIGAFTAQMPPFDPASRVAQRDLGLQNLSTPGAEVLFSLDVPANKQVFLWAFLGETQTEPFASAARPIKGDRTICEGGSSMSPALIVPASTNVSGLTVTLRSAWCSCVFWGAMPC